MGAVGNNILTITEPVIELDPFDIVDIESQSTGRDGNKNLASKYVGGSYPAIKINEYYFNETDVKYFHLDLTGFTPTLRIILTDERSTFDLSQYPKDGDIVSLYIRSRDEEIFKPIRMDFDILNVDSPAVSTIERSSSSMEREENGMRQLSFTMECRVKIPNLFKEISKAYEENTSFNHLEEVSSELLLGYASNTDDTDDAMVRINAYSNYARFIKHIIDSSYKTDNNFFTGYIDPYYYLNFVDINNQLKYDGNLEDSLISISGDINAIKTNEDVPGAVDTKLFLTNTSKYSGSTNHIGAYKLLNNTSSVVELNGYKRSAQYYDEDEKIFREFEITPLVDENIPEYSFAQRGRNGETRFEDEVKYKYMGVQSSGEDGNTHLNYHYAKLHNHQNKAELDKLKFIVDIPVANMGLYRYQKIPVIIYETSVDRNEVIRQRKARASDAGIDVQNSGSQEDDPNIYKNNQLNEFLTGVYVIEGIEYIYKKNATSISQRLTLIRREWNYPI